MTEEMRREREELLPLMMKYRQNGHKTFIRQNGLYVDGKIIDTSNVQKEEANGLIRDDRKKKRPLPDNMSSTSVTKKPSCESIKVI